MAIEFFRLSKGVWACAIIWKKKFISYFPSWVIEEFWLPFDGVGVLDFDRNSSVAIGHTLIVQWQPKFFSRH
jgi:hypothetical protein